VRTSSVSMHEARDVSPPADRLKKTSYSNKNVRSFDLNIEKILEGWEVSHALREIIANALDEQALTATKNISIGEDDSGQWCIRDYGRGLRYEHLTQNENPEKLANSGKVIGKFGVGLKDALATLYRHNVAVTLRSKFGLITLSRSAKHGFNDIVTLHAVVEATDRPGMVGTEVTLKGVTNQNVEEAKSYFLKFSDEPVIERTRFGDILAKQRGTPARIYVSGLRVAEESNFAFSYNITSLTKRMKDALNRERVNVGRTAYSDRVKEMLLESQSIAVARALGEQLAGIQTGTNSDEVNWTDVAIHAAKILNSNESVLFVSSNQILSHGDAIDIAQRDGIRIITIPETILLKIGGVTDLSGKPIRDIRAYEAEYRDSFQFKFVDYGALTASERRVFDKREGIIALDGQTPPTVKSIRLSETMRPDFTGDDHAQGLWDPKTGDIIIRRDQLRSVRLFAGTLLHEVAHARGGHADVTREFEDDLTSALGRIASRSLK